MFKLSKFISIGIILFLINACSSSLESKKTKEINLLENMAFYAWDGV